MNFLCLVGMLTEFGGKFGIFGTLRAVGIRTKIAIGDSLYLCDEDSVFGVYPTISPVDPLQTPGHRKLGTVNSNWMKEQRDYLTVWYV